MDGAERGGPQARGSKRVAIVGAGLAGLAASSQLVEAGFEVIVVERGRSVGGRLATRQVRRAMFDTGAQFFTVRSPEFAATVEAWKADGLVEEWCRGFGETPDGYPRYRATGGMRGLAQHLYQLLIVGDGVTVANRSAVATVTPSGAGWSLTYQGAARGSDQVDAVILTPPPPEALAILPAMANIDEEARMRLENCRYNSVIAILLMLDSDPRIPAPGAIQQPNDPTFTFIANNERKGISPLPAVTVHLSHPLSAALWDDDDPTVLSKVHQGLRRVINGASVLDVQVKRWRYAGPVEPFPHSFDVLAEQPGPLVIAGDAYAGSKVEGAFLSGLAAADHLIKSQNLG